MRQPNAFICTTCGRSYPLDTREWRCGCGGLFDLERWPLFDPDRFEPAEPGLWRYRRLLPLEPDWLPVSLGEGHTPLLPMRWAGQSFRAKCESVAPSGSFKDRGAATMVTALRGLGITRAVEDSSGNAGAALAAYAARAGIACEICVPNTAAGPKTAQMAAHGAEVIEIKGRREYAALAAWAAAAHGAYYASHVYNPFFLAGVETLAYELWEQLGRRAPEALVLPVGNGTLLLGLYRGFRRIQQAGLIEGLPRLLAAQAAACAPLYRQFHGQETDAGPADCTPSVAKGIAIAQPQRGQQILDAVRSSGGTMLQASEEAIVAARDALARQGFYVEETAATAAAVLEATADLLLATDACIVVLTGHGLKTDPHPRGPGFHQGAS
jgi:threonine synthase